MKLEFSFKDVTDNISRSIDLSQNTVIYGNNGRGKTRILSAINTLHEIADIDLRPAVLQMVEELNIEQLKIDNYDLSELFRRRDTNEGNQEFEIFLKDNEYPLRDFYGSILMIGQFSSLFSEVMYKYTSHLKNFIDYLNGDKRHIPKYYLSFRSFENMLRESQFSLRRIRNEIVHTQHFNPALEDLIPYVQDALSANDYLVRWLEKSRYDNVNAQSDRLIKIKRNLTNVLKSTNTIYFT